MAIGVGVIAPSLTYGERLLQTIQTVEVSLLFCARAAAEFAASQEWEEDGYESPIEWMKDLGHLSGGAASDRIYVGEQLDRLQDSVEAVYQGRIGFAHLAQIARAAAELGERLNEKKLLEKASQERVAKFRDTCMHARHAADAKAYNQEQAEAVEARRLSISRAEDGFVFVKGILDSVGGAALQTALEPLARRMNADDQRPRERRLEDALVDLSMHALDSGLVPQTASQRTHLQVTTTLETLLGLSGAPAGQLEHSLPISSKSVQRLACDCSVTRILLDADSMVIDVGRAKRVVSGPTRKALNILDGHCTWPGCQRPASYTSAHHLVHWAHGGSTDLSNLVLLCHRHHWLVHEGGWQMVRGEDGSLVTIPPPPGYWSFPRGPD